MKWVDSNIFLRYREGQEDAVGFVKRLEGGREKYKVSVYVVTEIEWVLRSFYKESKSVIVDFLEALLKTRNLLVENRVEMGRAVEIFEKYNVKLVDAVIAAAMELGDEIVSYDRDFDKLPGIKRIEPKDLVG